MRTLRGKNDVLIHPAHGSSALHCARFFGVEAGVVRNYTNGQQAEVIFNQAYGPQCLLQILAFNLPGDRTYNAVGVGLDD
jgi:hypothetical protein